MPKTSKNVETVFPVNESASVQHVKHRRRRSIIREFALNTSTHGLPGIARSESIHNRLFWLIATTTFSSVMFYFVIQSIRAFFNYPTATSVSRILEWPQYFPAFTFCNLSPLRYDRFIGPFLNYTNARNLTNTNDTSSFSQYQAMYIRDFYQYKLNRNESLNEYFYPISSMMMSCQYNGVRCTGDDFISFSSSIYGLCYTFNARMKNMSNGNVHYSTENGGIGTLELRLYVHSHQYVPFINDGKYTLLIKNGCFLI
jgi:hypothetical protein